jgi:hypothetical protein
MIKIGAGNLNEVFEELEREKGISKEVVVSSLVKVYNFAN